MKVNIDDMVLKYDKKFGHQSAQNGSIVSPQYIIPTGSLALDYQLGGGWRSRTITEVYGKEDVGKTSCIGLSAVKEAQKQGRYAALISVEASYDPTWATKLGVDTDRLIVFYPDDGTAAFEMLYDMVMEPSIDLILFDSIGAVLRPSEAGDDGKMSQGGASGLITHGMKRIRTPVVKQDKVVLVLNQVRDLMGPYPGVGTPGGHGLKHLCDTHIHLRSTPPAFLNKDKVVIGRHLKAIIKRIKTKEGSDQVAEFDFYQKSTPEHPLGIDIFTDTINVAIMTGVIKQAASMFYLDEEIKFKGLDKLKTYLKENPEAQTTIREKVLDTVGSQRNGKA